MKECESKLFMFKKDRNNPDPIKEHITNIKAYIVMFTVKDSEEIIRGQM